MLDAQARLPWMIGLTTDAYGEYVFIQNSKGLEICRFSMPPLDRGQALEFAEYIVRMANQRLQALVESV